MDAGADRRLAALEERVEQLQRQVNRLESAHSTLPTVEVEDPVPNAGRAEYVIGAQLLPRIGAVLIVLAILLLAAFGRTAGGGVDARIILACELLACAAFVGVGEWKRNELEGFGQVLSAIGSSGLYLASASASLAFHFIGLQALAVLLLGLSLANLAFAWVRRAPTFYVIAMLGGFAGATLPLREQNTAEAAAIYALLALAGACVAGGRRWPAAALAQWGISLAAFVWFVASDSSWVVLVPVILLSGLCAVAAYSHAFDDPPGKSWALPAPLCLFAVALIAFGIRHQPEGALPLAAYAGLAALFTLTLPSGSRVRLVFGIGAAASGALLVPGCFPPPVAGTLYVAFAIAGWGWGRVGLSRLGAIFALIEWLLAGQMFLVATERPVAIAIHGALLGVLAIGLIFVALAVRNAGWNGAVPAVLGSWILLTNWTSRIAPSEQGSVSAATIVWVSYAVFLMTLGFSRRSATLRFCSLAVILGTVAKILFFDLSTTNLGAKIVALLAVGIFMLVGGYFYIRFERTATTSSRECATSLSRLERALPHSRGERPDRSRGPG